MINTNLYIKPGQLRPLGLGKVEQRMVLNVVNGIGRLESRFLLLFHIFYFSKGKMDVCQHAAFALSRVLGARYDLPVSNTLKPNIDHIEIAVGVFAPQDLSRSFHQTFLKVFLKGKTFYLDPTLKYLEEDVPSIILREYPAGEFDSRLQNEFMIEPYAPNHRAYAHRAIIASQYLDLGSRAKYVEASLRLLHDPKLVVDVDQREAIYFSQDDWTRLDRIIRAIEPKGGLPSIETQVEQLSGDELLRWSVFGGI
ncbi:hypothetical protein HZC34_07565 [Candidatus Saganbacteria bacterium]|nr:hypothetical protein [Candidatus Saganbacteria bacterium]